MKRKPLEEIVQKVLDDRKKILREEVAFYEDLAMSNASYWGYGGPVARQEAAAEKRRKEIESLNICPFCGNKSGSVYGMAVMEQTDDEGIRFCWVRCNKCNAAGPKIRIHGNTGTETMIRKSVDAWNVRHRIDNNAKPPHAAHSMGAKKFKEV